MLSSTFGGGARIPFPRNYAYPRLLSDARDQNRQRVGFRAPKPSISEPHLRPVGFLGQIFRHPAPPATNRCTAETASFCNESSNESSNESFNESSNESSNEERRPPPDEARDGARGIARAPVAKHAGLTSTH